MNFVQSQQKAFMDPNDPTVIYISQPLRRRQTAGTREAI
jgi:hypothetical protein